MANVTATSGLPARSALIAEALERDPSLADTSHPKPPRGWPRLWRRWKPTTGCNWACYRRGRFRGWTTLWPMGTSPRSQRSKLKRVAWHG